MTRPLTTLFASALCMLSLCACDELLTDLDENQEDLTSGTDDVQDLGNPDASDAAGNLLDATAPQEDTGSSQASPDLGEHAKEMGASAPTLCSKTSLMSPWSLALIGPHAKGAHAGMTTDGGVCLSGGGEDVWGSADNFVFVQQTRQGDFTLTAQVTAFMGTDKLAKLGLMVRASLAPDAPHAFLHLSPHDTGHFLTSRPTRGAMTSTQKLPPEAGAGWLRLTRRGQQIMGERSQAGERWEEVGQITLPALGESAHVGLAITSHEGPDVLANGGFKSLTWGTPPAQMMGCGDGVCWLDETCTTCAADCSCDAQGIVQSPYVKTPAPSSFPRPTASAPVTRDGLRYTLVNADLRHYYSNVPTFNADDSLILLSGSRAPLYDAKTLDKIRTINASFFSGHRAWLNLAKNRTKQFGVTKTAAYLFDVLTDEHDLLYDFSNDYDEIRFGPGEGSVSNDDRVVALVGKKGGHAHVMAFDLVAKKVLGKKVFTGRWPDNEDKPRFDHALVSASGKWVVVNSRNSNYEGGNGGHLRYDTAFKTELRVTPVGKHSDVCINQAGEDVLIALSNPTHGMYRLSDGQKQQLPTLGQSYGGHISCQNTKRPGWAYVSRSDTKELIALKLDDTKTVERFGWHFSTQHDYKAESHACASRDGSTIIFNSDWGDTKRTPGAYIVQRVK